MALIIPSNYKQTLTPETTEQAIQLLKNCFQEKLSKTLSLRRVTAPLFVLSGTVINDDLNECVAKVHEIIQSEHDKITRNMDMIKEMRRELESFRKGE